VKKLRDQTVNPEQIQRFLESADKKLKDAHRVVGINQETAFQMASRIHQDR